MGYLEESFAQNGHAQWHPKGDELHHVFAVLSGSKPAATLNPTPDMPFSERELVDFARSNGCKVLAHAEAQITEIEREGCDVTLPVVSVHKALFLYRDDRTRDEYIRLMRAMYVGKTTDSEYHRRFGEILGYRDDEISAFVARRESMPHDPKDILKKMTIQQCVELFARPAVYDALAKDPIWEGILQPRKAVQISPD